MQAAAPLVLFYNRFFDDLPDLAAAQCPHECAFTDDRARLAEADAVVFHIPTFRPSSRLRKYPGQLWIAWSMESEVNVPRLADRAFMRHFDLRMSHRRDAEIWCGYHPPLQVLAEALRRPLPHRRAPAPAVLIRSAPLDRSGRDALTAGLMRRMKIDSYGNVANNRPLVEDRGRPTKLATIAPYKFTLAFENSIAPDYVTEKFFDPLLAGSVPVYLGAPNVADFAPSPDAYIDAAAFGDAAALADHLNALDRDEAAYRAHLAWRERPLDGRILAMARAAEEPLLCRLARVVGARRAQRAKGAPRYPFARPLVGLVRGWFARRGCGHPKNPSP